MIRERALRGPRRVKKKPAAGVTDKGLASMEDHDPARLPTS